MEKDMGKPLTILRENPSYSEPGQESNPELRSNSPQFHCFKYATTFYQLRHSTAE